MACERMRPLPDAMHQEAIELYREYLIVGGMPAPARAFLETQSFMDVLLVQNGILSNYVSDMVKFAPVTIPFPRSWRKITKNFSTR